MQLAIAQLSLNLLFISVNVASAPSTIQTQSSPIPARQDTVLEAFPTTMLEKIIASNPVIYSQNEVIYPNKGISPPSANLLAESAIPATIIEKIIARSKEAGVNPYVMTELFICESGLNPKARNLTKKEDSRGVAQINIIAHPEYDASRLYEVDYNLEMAFDILKKEGPGAWKNCMDKHLAKK